MIHGLLCTGLKEGEVNKMKPGCNTIYFIFRHKVVDTFVVPPLWFPDHSSVRNKAKKEKKSLHTTLLQSDHHFYKLIFYHASPNGEKMPYQIKY